MIIYSFNKQIGRYAVRICGLTPVISQWNRIYDYQLKLGGSRCRFAKTEVWDSHLESRKVNGLRNCSSTKGPLRFVRDRDPSPFPSQPLHITSQMPSVLAFVPSALALAISVLPMKVSSPLSIPQAQIVWFLVPRSHTDLINWSTE